MFGTYRPAQQRAPVRRHAQARNSDVDLVIVSGWTGAGKSTVADRLGNDLGATVASFDWLMSALRADPELWATVEFPLERQRATGWASLTRVAEQQLRRGASVVLDLVARDAAVSLWRSLAAKHGARFSVIECTCSDIDVHRSRIDGRVRDIPGWYELEWEHVRSGRERYLPLECDKLSIDTVMPFERNYELVRGYLGMS